MKEAEFKCMKCGEEWKAQPGPQLPCMKCGSIYMARLNKESF